MRWQKRARLGIAIFGIAFAVVVYSAIGERATPAVPAAPERLDPKATVETSRGVLDRITGAKQDFTITFERNLTYENGVTRLIGVRIDVKERQGRDFVITSGEAHAGEQQQDIRLTSRVKMAASDGFVLTTEAASFNQLEGVVRTPGPVSFSKGSMSGNGVGMAYDKNTDVLTVLDQAHVRLVDSSGSSTGEFRADKAILARQENYLLLEGSVHARRGEQAIEADQARANLTDDETTITGIELRGHARVAGGSSGFEGMSARDIDLDYAADGVTVEHVALTGDGNITLKRPEGRGEQMRGDTLSLALARDGTLTSATGRGGVFVQLPMPRDAGPRGVTAQALEASGEPGKGMTGARFDGNVEYQEEGSDRSARRVARSRALQVALDAGDIGSAIFTGAARFEEDGLTASAAEARYVPVKGVLQLQGVDEGGGPRVADEQIAVEAAAIDVTLQGRHMVARGGVKTVLRGKAKTPGLLKQGQPTAVSAGALTYRGERGRAEYTGGAQLWQGDTAIRADSITIDQESGNLTASGGARSTLSLGGDASIGRADEIRYEDTTRQIVYATRAAPVAVVTSDPPSAAKPDGGAERPADGAPAVPATPAALSHLSGPQGDLIAERIVVHLAAGESRMERLDAYSQITLRLDTRVATGARLTHYTADQRYVLSGRAAAPVKVVETCRETTGQTLTFFKSADRIIVDGNEERRTQTKTGGGPCPEPQSR